jgi:hypothetical protein
VCVLCSRSPTYGAAAHAGRPAWFAALCASNNMQYVDW